MNILIVGGLLIIGVGALVALFFVLRSGNTAQANAREAIPQTAREVPPIYEPASQLEQPHVETQTRVDTPALATRTVPVVETTIPDGIAAHPVHGTEQPLRVRLNGQFHELAHGLRSLQQQATEMEQRLSSLNQMLETIERDQH
ncbi:MAG: hypothetical protein PVS3B3_11810 [Ktedonobacteraceae bacterium]